MIKVSVIIPVYNAQEYLEQCLQSVQRQTMKELEILCINDGSTDDSLRILEEMRREDKRIRILEQTNQGAGTARNLAIESAMGAFVCFLDADDYWIDDSALEKMYESAMMRGVDVCGGQYHTDQKGVLKKINVYGTLCGDPSDEWFIKYAAYQFDYYYTNYIYRRKMLLDHSIFFPLFRRFEDPPFFVRAMSESEAFCVVDVPFYCYRIGYKEVHYTEEIMAEQMSGMIENLIFSKEKGLKKLHRRTYYRILEICNRGFYQFVLQKNTVLLQKLHEANSLIQWNWLEEVCKVREHRLRPLVEMTDDLSEKDINPESCTEKWPLPIEYLNDGNRIVLYGAGDVGKCYFRQIQKNRNVILCAWADQNYEKKSDKDHTLISPEQIAAIDFDYVVIAAAEIMMAMDMMDYLVTLKISSEKVVWDIGT